jgi:hypothetical protein
MKILEVEPLAQAIHSFVTTKHPVLFSGSGLGKRVGMPLWGEFIEHLACVCEKHGDGDSAKLIRKNAAQGDYVRAAGVYELCGEIPNGERLKELAKPFAPSWDNAKLELLKPMFELPFGAVVTTNYDRSQHDAYSYVRHRSPPQIELDDSSLRQGALQTTFFIARIHGRAELPQSIVLFPSGYQQLEQNQVYKDFLLTLLNERPCLFLGFSFLDPAIRQVLTLYEKQAGPAFKTLHCALLPSDSSPELWRLLMRLNIQTYFYDSTKAHRALWQALHKAQALTQALLTPPEPSPMSAPDAASYSSIQRYLGFAYAQQKSAKQLRPLLQQARDGLMMALIRDTRAAGISEKSILASTKDTLHLTEEETALVVRDSIARLLADGDIQKKNELYLAVSPEPELLTKHLATLVSGIVSRMKVREGVALGIEVHPIIREALERIFILRAWDLAAHYAGGGAGYGSDLLAVVKHVFAEVARAVDAPRRTQLERCTIDLLTAPSDREAEHLAEVGRTAFALQLVLSTPRQALLQRHALPQAIYFDASVLLPTLVPGHPLRPVYRDAIKRLGEAAKQAGTRCELIVGVPFLNEVISHRQIAVRTVRDQRLDDPKSLRRLVTFYGADNVNVFIGAFATHVAKAESSGLRPPKFAQFLSQMAPYENETALAAHLKSLGIRVLLMDFRQIHNHEFVRIFNPLVAAYESRVRDILAPKEKVLIQHEAAQIAQLKLDNDVGGRAIFVSADRALRRALLSAPELRSYASMVVPPQGFIGLVDIMVGLKADRRSLARLIWAAPRRDAEQAIRDYLVRHALDQMDAAVAKNMPEVIDEMLAGAKRDLEAANFDMTSANDADDVARTARFMDRLDEDFLERMEWWIDRQEEQEPTNPRKHS